MINFWKTDTIAIGMQSLRHTYEHNSYGYRTKEFNFDSPDPSILCLGCSYTYGAGVKLTDTWVAQIEKQYPEYAVYNLGYPGGSGDTVVRTLASLGDKLNIKKVCILWPVLHRFELYHQQYVENILISDTSYKKFFMPELLNNEDSHFKNLRYKNQLLVNLLAEKYQYQIIENSTDWVSSILVDRGRDIHPGPQTHQLIANYYISQIG